MVEAVLPVVEVGLVNRAVVGRLGGSRGWSRRRLRCDGDVFLRSGHCVGAVWGYQKETMKDDKREKKRVKEYQTRSCIWSGVTGLATPGNTLYITAGADNCSRGAQIHIHKERDDKKKRKDHNVSSQPSRLDAVTVIVREPNDNARFSLSLVTKGCIPPPSQAWAEQTPNASPQVPACSLTVSTLPLAMRCSTRTWAKPPLAVTDPGTIVGEETWNKDSMPVSSIQGILASIIIDHCPLATRYLLRWVESLI